MTLAVVRRRAAYEPRARLPATTLGACARWPVRKGPQHVARATHGREAGHNHAEQRSGANAHGPTGNKTLRQPVKLCR